MLLILGEQLRELERKGIVQSVSSWLRGQAIGQIISNMMIYLIKAFRAKKSKARYFKLTLVTSFKEFNCNSLMFSTKNGATDNVDIWRIMVSVNS